LFLIPTPCLPMTFSTPAFLGPIFSLKSPRTILMSALGELSYALLVENYLFFFVFFFARCITVDSGYVCLFDFKFPFLTNGMIFIKNLKFLYFWLIFTM